MVDKTLIKTLVESWGPSGHEHVIRATIQKLVRDLADETYVDAGGNLVCRLGKGGTRIMIAAHMDEIGLIVSHLDRDGFARFAPLGGLFWTTLNGNRVRFENGTVGVIGVENGFDLSKTPRMPDFFVDFSANKDGSGPVSVGDAAGMLRTMEERGDRLIAKSMDDRIGCAVAIEAMRKLAGKRTGHELYFVFTTQEEVGVRGARTGAFGVAPDYGIALDVTATGDVPKEKSPAVKLGHGAAIKVVDVMHIVPPAFKALLIKRAQEAGIPYQLEILTVGSTDAAAIQITAAGIPSATISIPCRFVHTTSETVDVNDVEACIDLLVEVVSKPLDGLEKP